MKYLLIIIVLISSTAISQNIGSKDFYLIDSLDLNALTSDDVKLIDSCLNLFHNSKDDTIRINSINEIVNQSWDQNVWPKYNEWIYKYSSNKLKQNQHISSNEARLLKGFVAGSLNNMGLLYSNQGKIEKALEKYHQAIKILIEIKENDVRATCLNNIGILYNSQNDLKNALKYFHESLAIREQLGNDENTSAALNNIGFIYGKLENYKKAKEYHLQSLEIRKELNDKRGIAESLNNLGTVSKREAEELETTNGNKDSINLKVKIALDYFKQSIEIQKEIKDITGMSNTYNNIAHIYYDDNNMIQSAAYGKKALTLAKENKHAANIKKSAELLARVYENLNKGMEALEMYKLFISTRDTIANIQTQKATIEQNLQYEFDKKEALSKLEHEKELALKEADKKKQTIVIWSGSIMLVLIVVFSAFIMHRLKISNRQKSLIEQKNKENELLLGEIHHRVKNNLQVISSLLSLQERSIDDESAKAAILEGKERVKSMGLIHKMLYQNDNYSGIDMDSYAQKLVNGLLDSFGMNESKISVDINFEKLKLDIDTAIPVGLIINELVINALKYAYTKTETPSLKVSLAEINENLILEVEDNGEGNADHIENSKSFGMKLIKSLSRQLGGKILISDDSGINVKINISDYKLV